MTNTTPAGAAMEPCPFCGESVEIQNEGSNWYVWCDRCDFAIEGFLSESHAIERWNRRTANAQHEQLIAERDALAAKVERLTEDKEFWRKVAVAREKERDALAAALAALRAEPRYVRATMIQALSAMQGRIVDSQKMGYIHNNYWIPRIDAALQWLQHDAQQQPVSVQPLDMPDGDGYFAFEGRIDGSNVERLRWLVMVRRNSIDKELYIYRFGGQTFKVKQMIGQWWPLTMPWEQPATAQESSEVE